MNFEDWFCADLSIAESDFFMARKFPLGEKIW